MNKTHPLLSQVREEVFISDTLQFWKQEFFVYRGSQGNRNRDHQLFGSVYPNKREGKQGGGGGSGLPVSQPRLPT